MKQKFCLKEFIENQSDCDSFLDEKVNSFEPEKIINEKKRRTFSSLSSSDSIFVKRNEIVEKVKKSFGGIVDEFGTNFKKISNTMLRSKVPKSSTNMVISDIKNKNLEIANSLSADNLQKLIIVNIKIFNFFKIF